LTRDLGRRYKEVVRINSQSGKGGVLSVLERDFRITLSRWLQIEFSKAVQGEVERSGGDASAMACVRVQIGDEVSVGVAFAEDTTSATLQAVLSAMGRTHGKEECMT